MRWKRCGTSAFYRSVVDARDPNFLKHVVDPVDLVDIRSLHYGQGILVWRRQLADVPEEFIGVIFSREDAKRLHAWLLRVIEGEEAGGDWIPELLADLEVDPVERDKLLDSISRLIVSSPDKLLAQVKAKLQWDADQVEQIFTAFGVPC